MVSEVVTSHNVLEDFDGVLLAMAEIEGYEWLSGQLEGLHSGDPENFHRRSNYGFAYYFRWLKELEELGIAETNPHAFTVYGSGGIGRWFIKPNGEVSHSSSHGTLDLGKAQDLGFGVY